MNSLSVKKYFLFLFLLSLLIGSCKAPFFHKSSSGDAEKELFNKTRGKKEGAKVKEPGLVVRTKREQEANDRKLKKEYKKFIERSKKRTFDIQTREVQARMKLDRKNSSAMNKAKKKKAKSDTKKAGKKYK
ncbi:MAG: hypothetical protein WCS03_10935 [Bacteroidota bacterium]